MDGAVLSVGVWGGQAPDVQEEGAALVSKSATGTWVTHPLGKVPAQRRCQEPVANNKANDGYQTSEEQQKNVEKLCTDKKATQREKTKKCRVNRWFKDQIDKDFHDVEREIWMGPRPKLLRSVGVILSEDIGNTNITATIRRRCHRII